MPLFKVGATPEVECPKCDRRYSKDGWLEDVLASTSLDLHAVEYVAARAFEWAAIERTKLSHLHPSEPTKLEWFALRELANAQAEYESEKFKAKPEGEAKPTKAYGEQEWRAQSVEYARQKQRQNK